MAKKVQHLDWDCVSCPEQFASLRELNDHTFDRKTGKQKDCPKPYPTPRWYMERFEVLMAEIKDLKARIKRANKWVGHINNDYVGGALDLRRKNWRKTKEKR